MLLRIQFKIRELGEFVKLKDGTEISKSKRHDKANISPQRFKNWFLKTR